MKQLIIALTLCLIATSCDNTPKVVVKATFVHPFDYTETPENEANLKAFIKQNVKRHLATIGVTDGSIINESVKEEIKCFHELRNAKDKEQLNSIIQSHKDLDHISYIIMVDQYYEEPNEEE